MSGIVEVWKPVPGYEGAYEVSDLGRVRSNYKKGRILKAKRSTHTPPRMQVELYAKGRGSWKTVHRLVLEAFKGPAPEGTEGCHLDGDPSNNRLENLRWDSHKKNMEDRAAHGTLLFGEHHPQAKYNATDVERMRDMKRAGCNFAEIARWLEASRAQVSQIVRGDQWKRAVS